MGNAPQLAPEGSNCLFCIDLPHPVATHCRTCHASWNRSSKTGHCATCHETFSTPGVFDLHLLSRGCAHPSTIVKRDGTHIFDLNPRPNAFGTRVWRTPGLARDDDA